MPIKINADANTVTKLSKQLYTPKFFSKDITGNGKTLGLINQSMFPSNIPTTKPVNTYALHQKITTYNVDLNKCTSYPINPLGFTIPLNIKNAMQFDSSWFNLNNTSYIALIPYMITIVEPLAQAIDSSGQKADTKKSATITYCLMKITVDTSSANNDSTIDWYEFTENPLRTFEDNISTDASETAKFFDYLLTQYNLYTEICKLSETWQTKLTDTIINTYDAYLKQHFALDLPAIIRFIAQYKVSLSQYKDLYDALKQRLTERDLKTITRMNTSLLLQDTLAGLAAVQFPTLPAPGSTNRTLDLSWCSKEQFDAITSDKPLNQVQAGAGTGKSTVIKSRLDYLEYLDVDLNKVMVLSFTNAAADNIKARCPKIKSMTIASMIDEIYTKNHPTHQLSSALSGYKNNSTFTNSLQLYRGMPYVEQLIHAINGVEKNNDYATLLRLCEEHHSDIIAILDKVRQTTFQLEIILCYLEHATMTIPFDIEHLLIDEVQDNAIFEFIFFLNLTCKLKNHLYLVGDCSQTLYEFRASDPKALNAIEGSGIFASFPLNINYRSNQNILSFANSLLGDIEANQHANIQLQAFNLNTITKQSFADAVIVDYNKINKIRELHDWLYTKLHNSDFTDWVDAKLKRHEQICVLSYKRADAVFMQKTLEQMYPNHKFTSIIPVKNKTYTQFSDYVLHNEEQLNALPLTSAIDICDRIRAEILVETTNSAAVIYAKDKTAILANVQKSLQEWQAENLAIIQDKLNVYQKNLLSHYELINIIKETLIDFEIKKNALRQSLVSQKNASRKENTDNADFVFSTIHSAKGLEFDNVVLLYHNENAMSEELKRMYYVALTRAKQNEYIIAYDTTFNAAIQTRYDNILAQLPDDTTIIAAS